MAPGGATRITFYFLEGLTLGFLSITGYQGIQDYPNIFFLIQPYLQFPKLELWDALLLDSWFPIIAFPPKEILCHVDKIPLDIVQTVGFGGIPIVPF